MSVRIQMRRDTSTNWTTNNPTLAEGEMGLELDTNRWKIGSGSDAWNALPYSNQIFSGPATISDSGSGNALTITQTGVGNALVVEDSSNPDSTPFVINASGNVGIGKTSPSSKLDVDGTGAFSGTLTAPTAAVDTNTTQVATTAYVIAQGYIKSASASSTYQPLDADLTAIAANTSNGILKRTATDTWTVITDNSTNWDTAYTDRNKWDGGATGLTAATGRTSLGLGTMATETASNYALLASPTLTGTPLSTTASADTNTTQIATTAFVVGQAASATSPMNGTAATGTSLKYARQDHVHPVDTSRSPLAGSSSITTVGTIGSGTWNGSAIAAGYGGTGLSSYTTGDILYASSSSDIGKLADIATGNALISGGVGAAPSWGKIGLSTHVSGTLPVANGGTGTTTSTGTGSVVLSSGATISSATSISVTGTQTLASYRVRNIYVSTTDPGTGSEGDIWLKY